MPPQNHRPPPEKAQTKPAFPAPKSARFIIDTACFGHGYGMMALLDSINKQALFVGEVAHETKAPYLAAMMEIQEKGTAIQSMACERRGGLDKHLPTVQMPLGHFHQMQTVSRYSSAPRKAHRYANCVSWRQA